MQQVLIAPQLYCVCLCVMIPGYATVHDNKGLQLLIRGDGFRVMYGRLNKGLVTTVSLWANFQLVEFN